MRKSHDAVYKQSKQTPTFFIRYEDLKLNPLPTLKDLLAFMLDVETIEGTVIEARLKQVCSTDYSTKARYKLKSNSPSLCSHRGLYSEK